MMDNEVDDRTIVAAYDRPSRDYTKTNLEDNRNIRKLTVTTNNFEIKATYYPHVKDPNAHLENF